MKRFGIFLFILVFMLCAAGAAELKPLEPDPAAADPANGNFEMKIRGFENGYIIASLYTTDLYSAEEVKALAPGDQVTVAGVTYTVSELVDHGEGVVEIYPAEEFWGYLVLRPHWEDETLYYAVEDDWSPCTWAADVTIAMPLPDAFVYVEYEAGEEIEKTAGDLAARLEEEDGARWFTQYNTSAEFRDGMLMKLTHSDYPEGPEETVEPGNE